MTSHRGSSTSKALATSSLPKLSFAIMTQCILAGYAPYVPSKANASTGGREATLIATTPMCCNVVALRSPSAHSSMRRSTFWLSLKGPGRHSPTCGGSVCMPLPTKVPPRSRAALAFASLPEAQARLATHESPPEQYCFLSCP